MIGGFMENIIKTKLKGPLQEEANQSKSTLTGDLVIFENFPMPQFEDGRRRTIRVWTPPNYKKNGKILYPVIYMHDGQNLFDDATSFAGEWHIDETITALVEAKLSKGYIVVGIDNSERRLIEYLPAWDETLDAEGDLYGRFIVETLKPFIDSEFLTRVEKEYTMIAGSSMGGLISFYIGLSYPEVFGKVGAFSPSFHMGKKQGRRAFIDSLEISEDMPRLYMDAGKKEKLYKDIKPVCRELRRAKYPRELIERVIEKDHGHNEQAWAIRFPYALKWLFSDFPGNYAE